MQLSDMRTAVRNRLGRDTYDSFYTDAILTDLINEALFAIEAEAEWPWDQKSEVITTVAGTTDYSPAADWYRTKSLYITNYNPMDNYPIEEVEQIISTSRPRIFCVWGDKISLRPIPDGVYSVNHQYYANPTALSADGDTPIIPVAFQYGIVAKALALAYQRAGDEARHSVANTEYNAWLERMMSFKRRVTGVTRPRIRPGNDW